MVASASVFYAREWKMLQLPTEILIMICRHLRDSNDWVSIHNMSLTSSRVRAVASETCDYTHFFKSGKVYIATKRYNYGNPDYFMCKGLIGIDVYFARLRSERADSKLMLSDPVTVVDDIALEIPLDKFSLNDGTWTVDSGHLCTHGSFTEYVPGEEPELPAPVNFGPGCLIA